ncbi:MAG: discoidin domain-containing protein [Phycisphaerae bacterium]|nr:discoidin domain-containing protein [Phycisphaerae bacterium]
MKRFTICLATLILMSQLAVADYILTSGSNDTGTNGGQSIIRYTDDFQVVWERSPAKKTAETQVFTIEVNPTNGDVYTSQITAPQLGKHLAYADGSYIGRAIPQPGQTDGTGKYTAPSEAIQDIRFGYDYNKDGVPDLWVCRRDTFEVYDGTTLNRTGDNGTADLLTSLKIADTGGSTGVQDGTGGFGITFGPDVTGEGVGELYAMAGLNAATGTRLSVWNPVTMTKVATYNADGTKDNCLVILGPDVNGDGKEDLWVADPRNHRIRAYNCATGTLAADSISLVKADAPGTIVTLRFPTDIDYGPEGTLLITTRFATSLDAQWTGPADTAGGDLLQVKWDPASKKGLTTLLFEYPKRLDSVAYVAPQLKSAVEPYPTPQTVDVSRDVILSWKPGKFADTHDVYLGTDADAVKAAGRANPSGVLVSQAQDANTYEPAAPLELGMTYFWRVDEVNAPPSSAIAKGVVWSFTVEPVAYPIANVTATASSAQAGMGPERTIDGSGLNTNDQHSTQATDMWLSNVAGPQPTWIQYEFDGIYKLYEMWVWNSNQAIETTFGLGIKDTTIEVSTDGSNWTTLSGPAQFAQAPGLASYTHNTTVKFGVAVAKYVRITASSNWGNLVKQYSLSEVRFFYIPVQAREPKPASGDTNVAVNTVLGWRAGREAASHKVYFGTDRQAVATGAAPLVTTGQSSYQPDPLNLGRTYYWKVDEVNDAASPELWAGDVWSFTTQEYAVVDDFEGYDDKDNRIYDAWIDGMTDGNSGSIVGHLDAPFAEQTIVHGGRQSMPLEYNNVNAPFYSEAQRTFDAPQDWTANGADTLSLYFRGPVGGATQPGNGPQPLYVVVEDKAGHKKTVVHPNPEATVATTWQQWQVPLSDLSAAGVNLTSVKKMSIGVGSRTSPTLGAAGVLYLDDIGVGHPAATNP